LQINDLVTAEILIYYLYEYLTIIFLETTQIGQNLVKRWLYACVDDPSCAFISSYKVHKNASKHLRDASHSLK